MLNEIRFIFLAVFVLVLVSLAHSEEDALSIIERVEEKQAAETSKVELSMLIYPDADDERNVRKFRVRSYSKGDEDTYMVFLAPRTIKGLSILSKGGDQWVYFPSTGRVRKIAGKKKKESVRGVGGDFSYEDLGGGRLQEKYTFKILKTEPDRWIIGGESKKSDSTYTRIVITIDKANYLVMKVQYYTKEEGHYKDLDMSSVKMMGGREIPTRMVMINHHKNSKTVVITHAAQYDITINDKYFNPTRFYK